MNIVVTDDEIATAAVLAGRPWQGLLPTLDLGTDGVLEDAVVRGGRSLQVRALLLEAEALFTEAAIDLARLTTGRFISKGYTASRLEPTVPIGAGAVFVASGAQVLVDATTDTGVHDIAVVGDWREAWDVVGGLMTSIDVESLGEDLVFTFVTPRADGSGAIAIVISSESVRDLELTTAPTGEIAANLMAEGDLLVATERLFALWPNLFEERQPASEG